MIKHDFYIARLIARHLAGEATETEKEELAQWRNESPQHESLFLQICCKEHIRHKLQQRKAFDTQQGWEEMNKTISRNQLKRRIRNACRHVAILALPIAMSIFLAYRHNPHPTQTAVPAIEHILPGGKKAILTLDNGQTICLHGKPDTKVQEKDGTTIQMDSAAMNYQPIPQRNVTIKEVYNRIDIPRGGEYKLTLSDGTKIYLNSMSSLRYPVQFTQDTRQVELQGEGYFEVSKSEKPFLVKTNGMQIEVLGTTFNISAYPDEPCQATLVNGSIKVTTPYGNSRLLKPSEQACANPQDNTLEVHEVNTDFHTSWIHGKINFKDQRLEDIMKSLTRWYDMQVVYKDEAAKNARFGCYVDRYDEITPFVNLLEKTGKVSITIKGKNISISTNN